MRTGLDELVLLYDSDAGLRCSGLPLPTLSVLLADCTTTTRVYRSQEHWMSRHYDLAHTVSDKTPMLSTKVPWQPGSQEAQRHTNEGTWYHGG